MLSHSGVSYTTWMGALVATYFTQHPKGNRIMLTAGIEAHLKELGILSEQVIEDFNRVADTRHVYLEKGYFNDPRNGNGEVPF